MIGDVLTSSILFELLREKYPNAQLDYLINSNTFPVVEGNPYIDSFIFYTKEVQASKKALYKLGRLINKEKYDVLIDVYSKLSSNLITLLSGAKSKISYFKYYSAWIYDHNIHRKTATESEAGLAIINRLQLLGPLEIVEKPVHPKIYLTQKEIADSKKLLQSKGVSFKRPLFMISVLGSGIRKTYPFKYMAKVLDTLVENTKGQLLFNYIPNQLKDAQSILNLCSEETKKHIYFDISGKDLREFLAITAHCDALIGNEGGAVNMAKAIHIPTFAIYAPWIDKATWNVFEDSHNIAVHLNDYKPKLFNNKPIKLLKKEVFVLYNIFEPELFENELKKFLHSLEN